MFWKVRNTLTLDNLKSKKNIQRQHNTAHFSHYLPSVTTRGGWINPKTSVLLILRFVYEDQCQFQFLYSTLHPFHQRVELSVQHSIITNNEHILVHAFFVSPLCVHSNNKHMQRAAYHGTHHNYRHQSNTWMKWWLNQREALCRAILQLTMKMLQTAKYVERLFITVATQAIYLNTWKTMRKRTAREKKRGEPQTDCCHRNRLHWQSLFREAKNIQLYSV